MHKVLLPALFLALFVAPLASADTITTGNISFTCAPACSTTPDQAGFVSTAPTEGSFVYDNTTNKLLNLTLTWNGLMLSGSNFAIVFPPPPNNSQGIFFSELISGNPSPLFWTGVCSLEVPPGPIPDCAGDFNGFDIGDPNLHIDLALAPPFPGAPAEFPNDVASGTAVATDLVVTTPEPGMMSLLLLGIGALGVARHGCK